MGKTFQVEAKIKNANIINQLWKHAPEIARVEMRKAVLEAELLYEATVKERTPLGVTGVLRGSISAQDPFVTRDKVIGVVGTAAQHALPVELGTKPHFPPLQPLEDWVRLKLDVEPDSVPAVALSIARKIAAHGTEGAFMFETALEDSQGDMDDIFNSANVRILKRLAN